MVIEMASNGVREDTSSLTSELFVKAIGYSFRQINRIVERKSPMRNDVMTTLITANLAVLGCPAPSSLDTLTL